MRSKGLGAAETGAFLTATAIGNSCEKKTGDDPDPPTRRPAVLA